MDDVITVDQLSQLLVAAGLKHAVQVLPDLLVAAANTKKEPGWLLYQLLTTHLQIKEKQRYKHQCQLSRLNPLWSFDSFDAGKWPGDLAVVELLQADSWIRTGTDIVLVGPSGCGKSHLATAAGLNALKCGYSVAYTSLYRLYSRIQQAKDGNPASYINNLIAKGVLIIDEFGHCLPDTGMVKYLFQIINGRQEEGRPTIVTTNLPGLHWSQFLGADTTAMALADRLLDRRNVVVQIEQAAASFRTGASLRLLG